MVVVEFFAQLKKKQLTCVEEFSPYTLRVRRFDGLLGDGFGLENGVAVESVGWFPNREVAETLHERVGQEA